MNEILEYLRWRIESLEKALDGIPNTKSLSWRQRRLGRMFFEIRLAECREILGVVERMVDDLYKDCQLPFDSSPEPEPDAHSCREYADAYGYCQVCGAVVHGSLADYEIHGYDPPGTY